MVDPSVSILSNAQNATITGNEFITIGGNYIKNIIPSIPSTSDHIPPLSPLRHSSAFFTGRQTYLQVLMDHFAPKLDSERKNFLLYGMGGIGKTQICLRFIEQYGKKWFSDIFWIDASSEDTIDLCLRQIAQNYEVHSTPSAESALQWISDQNNWLMVFDNADGGYHVVEKFIPSGNKGSILITSRNRGLARITSGCHSLEVTEMGEEEAIVMLLKSAMINDNSVNVAKAAQTLVTALSCVPLAIDQAGSYMLLCGCGLNSYLELFSKHRAKLMSDEEFRGASLYKYSTYGTWEICIAKIKERAEGENSTQRVAAQSALIIHNIFAFLHHNNISEEIFANAAKNFVKRKNEGTNGLPQSISLLNAKTMFLNDDEDWDALQFQAGIKVLLSFSLMRSNGMLYSVHPLIQTWSRDRVPVESRSECYKKSRALLACAIKLDYEDINYRFCALLAPHIRRNSEHATECLFNEQYYGDDENGRFALVFDIVGEWNQAEYLESEALNARKTRLGVDHPDTLTVMGNLALTYSNQRKWNEAESLQVKVMEAREKLLGEFHPDTLTAMGNLASTYRNQGKWNEAESLQVKVMEASEKLLGELHPDTFTAMANLASTYSNQGKWNEAESLEVKVMEAREKFLAELHPDTLSAMANLASTYRNQGKWNDAESLEVKVMEAREKLLGELHPHTLTAMASLASTYSNQGKWNEAESIKVKVMEAREKLLGELHPDTLTAMGNLASTYRNKGKWNEAENLEVKVMEAREKLLGELHPHTLIAMGNLASTYWNQGKWNEAESLQVKVMEAREKLLGELHPHTLSAMASLAVTYWSQGKWNDAESLEVKVMEASEKLLGELHPDTLTAMGNLALTYWNQGKWNEAESLQVKVMEASEKLLGDLHPDTLTAMGNLALTYWNQGKQNEAESLEVKVMEAREKLLGELHPDTLTTMGNLASTYRNQGKWNEAESLEVKVMEAREKLLGELHPDTLTAMANLALSYKAQNKLKEAIELLQASISGMEQVLGVQHPTTIQYMQILADNTWHAKEKTSPRTPKGALSKYVDKIKSRISKVKTKKSRDL